MGCEGDDNKCCDKQPTPFPPHWVPGDRYLMTEDNQPLLTEGGEKIYLED